MIPSNKILTTALLLCFLSIIAAKKNPNTQVYRFESRAHFNMKPEYKTTRLQVFADAYVTPTDQTGNTLSVTMANPTLTVRTHSNKLINVVTCLSNKEKSDLQRPFQAVFKENGVFDHIKVGSQESKLAINIKLYQIEAFQIDKPQIEGKASSPDTRNQMFYVGNCPTKNELLSQTNGNYHIRQTANLSECDEVKNNHRGDKHTCLSRKCRPDSDKNIQYTSYFDATVEKVNNQFIIEQSVHVKDLSFYPYKNSSSQLKFHFNAINTLIEVGTEDEVSMFNDNGQTSSFSRSQYMTINKGICNTKNENNNNKYHLKELYSALSCQQSLNIAEDMLERAIQCQNN